MQRVVWIVNELRALVADILLILVLSLVGGILGAAIFNLGRYFLSGGG